jgi:hypothetical protein
MRNFSEACDALSAVMGPIDNVKLMLTGSDGQNPDIVEAEFVAIVDKIVSRELCVCEEYGGPSYIGRKLF